MRNLCGLLRGFSGFAEVELIVPVGRHENTGAKYFSL
jgi:hypothetical protein